MDLHVKPCGLGLVKEESLREISFCLKSNPGSKLHGFRSGGGLRVVRIDGDKLLGYGEHPNLDTALDYLAEDIVAGTREYNKTYGVIYDNYLTGSSEVTSFLDKWLLCGRSFDISFKDGFKFESSYLYDYSIPNYVKDAAMNGAVVCWQDSNIEYQTSPNMFPNGEKCTSTRQLTEGPYMGIYNKKLSFAKNCDFDLFYKDLNVFIEKLFLEKK